MHNLASALPRFLLAALVLVLASAAEARNSRDQMEKEFQTATSCAAYAFIQARTFPEAVAVYRDKRSPRDQLEQDRARIGMTWTNRVHFASSIGVLTFEHAAGRQPTNAEISKAIADSIKSLQGATELQQEAVHQKCKALFDESDEFCSQEVCVAKP